jgi:hypothetical protein
MKAAASLFLLAVAAANAQLTVTRTHEVVRHPFELMPMRIADLDGDGDSDLLLHGGSNQLTTWCENKGDDTFAGPVAIEMAPRVLNHDTPYLADLEDDGTVDLYTTSGTRTRSLGGGDFSSPEAVPGGIWPTPPPPSTFPNYRYPISDILLTLSGGPSAKDRLLIRSPGLDPEETVLRIYSIDAGGQAELSPLMAGGMGVIDPYQIWSPYNLVLLDAEDDGDLDLIFQDTLMIYRNRGDWSFDAPAEIDPGLIDSFHGGYTAVRIPGSPLPALLIRESYGIDLDNDNEADDLHDRLTLRFQSLTDGQFTYGPESPEYRLDFGGDDPLDILAVPAPDPSGGDEIWVRRMIHHPHTTQPPRDRLQAYRFVPGTGWVLRADHGIPGRGWGELHAMTLSPAGPPGLAIRLGGDSGLTGDREDKVVWASLESLRSGTPAWKTLAGPFNDFSEVRLADFDLDGKTDLVSGEQSHGLGGGKSGRLHFIHDIDGERAHQVVDTDSSDEFGGASLLPGNRIAIGDADGDLLPDLAVSDGPAEHIRLLRNLGGRSFAAPQILANSSSILRPLRLDPARHLFLNGQRLFSQAPSAGSPATLRHDLGVAGTVVFSDIDADGIQDIVAHPCPLGQVAGWGKIGPAGSVTSWRHLAPGAHEIRDSSGIPALGWTTGGTSPAFKKVVEGVPGIASWPLPGPAFAPPGVFAGAIGPPLDLDRDGDLDLLMLYGPPPEENFNTSRGFKHLVWQENRGSHWQYHPEVLFRLWHSPTSPSQALAQTVHHPGVTRVLVGNQQGELFQFDFAAPVPGGLFGTWLASFGLSGASAGAESDPDGDGLTNLEEALQGSSPVSATPGDFALPVSRTLPDGWSFSSALDLEGTGISVVAEVSPDLETWIDLPDPPTPFGQAGGRRIYRVNDAGMASEDRRFVRFRFAWQGP